MIYLLLLGDLHLGTGLWQPLPSFSNPLLTMRTQHGFSLIELLLVLGIVAAMAVAAFIVFPRVQASKLAQQHNWSVEERGCRIHTNNMDPAIPCELDGQVFVSRTGAGAATAPEAGKRAFTTAEEDQGGF